jgi:hypothetical protein
LSLRHLLRYLHALRIVVLTPKFKRWSFEFDAEFIRSRGSLISTPHYAASDLQARVGVFDTKIAIWRPVHRRKNQSPIQIYDCRQYTVRHALGFNL